MLALFLLVVAQAPTTDANASPHPGAPAAPAPTKATEKLVELRALLDDNQCEKLVSLSPYVEDHRLATQAERHEAMFMRAYCLVGTFGNIAEAGTVFNDILAEDIKANPTFDVEPRFQFLVDGARASLIEAQRAKKQAEHEKRIARVDFQTMVSPTVKGGNRVFFDVNLTDPDNVVRSMRVDFRKKGEREYYALPVAKRADGRWHGEVPGTYTKSSQGMTLEWFLTLSDDAGELLKSSGTRDAPHAIEVLPGSAIAEDLKASERVPHATRLVAGAAITPIFTLVGVAAGLLLSVGVSGALVFVNHDIANVAGGFTLLTMPVALGTGMVFLNATTILDTPDSWIATGIVGGFVLLGEVCLLADWLTQRRSAAYAVGKDVAQGDSSDGGGGPGNPPISVQDSQLIGVGGAAVLVGALAGAIATPILVGLDAPVE